MDPASVFKASGEAVSLVAALAKLIKENRGKKTQLSELLGGLQVEALRVSSDIERKLERLVERVHELGLKPNVTLDSQLEDLSWYNWVRRSELKRYREEFHAAYRQLTSFIDDASALMLCEGSHTKQDGGDTAAMVTDMFSVARRKKRELDSVLMDPHGTVGAMLDKLLSMSRLVTDELRSA